MKIEIYTKPNCSYCVHAKKFLQEKNIDYIEYKLNENFTREELLLKVPSAKTYPVILIDENFIGGFSDLKDKFEEKYMTTGEWNGA